MNISKHITVILFTLLLGACAGKIAVPAPAQLDNAAWSSYLTGSGLISDQQTDPRWWTGYQDQQLNTLVEAALAGNLDLKIARSRIRQARAEQRVELSVMAPRIDLNASLTEQRLSETGSIPAGRIPGFEVEQTIYRAGFDATWEIDLFGRNPKRRAIAESRYLNQLELQYDLHLAIAAEVTRAYLQLCGLGAQRKVLLKTVDHQQRIADAVRTQRDYGEAGTLEVNQAAALTAEYQAQLPAIDAQIRSLIYQISVLTGQPPDALNTGLAGIDTLPEQSTNSLAALTSDLLRRRADVRYAERQYIIASQQQKLAELAIYPTFSLFADAGPNTIDLDNFSDNESFAFNLGGLVHWPLYSGGQIRAQSSIAEELKIQAEYGYANTILKALQDVEVNAARLIESKNELAARKALHTARRQLADNMQNKYQAGVSSLVGLLNAEQQAMQSQLAELAVQSQVLQNGVALHKALGGGWMLFSEQPGK